MNCRNVASNLSAYVDNEVTDDIAREIRQHLCLCSRCRNEEHELRNLKALIGTSECPDLDPEFEHRLQQWLADPAKSYPAKRFSRTATIWLFAPACLLLFWILAESISMVPTAKNVPAPSSPNFAGTLARDQVYDLNASMPDYGAPVITAVDYAR